MTRFSRSDRWNEMSYSMILGSVSASDRIAPVHGGAADRPHAALHDLWLLAGQHRDKRLLDRNERVLPNERQPFLGEIQWNDRDAFEMDVLPDIELSPVGEREDTKTLAGLDA